MRPSLLAVVIGALLAANQGGRAAAPVAIDIPLAGFRMKLADSPQPRGRRNLLEFHDAALTLGTADPTITGATVAIGRIGSGSATVLQMPASGWSRSGTVQQPAFKYKSRTGEVRSARLIDGRSIRISARGAASYALGGIPQGSVGVIVASGDVRFCGLFGGTITKDDGMRFLARNAGAPAGCPDFGAATTTTTVAPTTTTAAPTTTTEAPTTTTTSSTTTTSEAPTTTSTTSTTTTSETPTTTTTVPPCGDCNDGFDCTNDSCDTTSGQCQHVPIHTLCVPASLCQVGSCNPSAGCEFENVQCDDGVSCTNDFCDSTTGECQFVPVHDLCDDGVPCTFNVCDPTAGCQFPPNQASCDDGDDTTTDRCEPGCDSSLASCDPATGCTHTGGGCGCS